MALLRGLVQRYYVRHDLTTELNARMIGAGLGVSATAGQINLIYPVEMRVVPVISHATIGNFAAYNGSSSPVLTGGFTKDAASTRSYNATFTVASGLAAAQSVHVSRSTAASPCWYAFDAEF